MHYEKHLQFVLLFLVLITQPSICFASDFKFKFGQQTRYSQKTDVGTTIEISNIKEATLKTINSPVEAAKHFIFTNKKLFRLSDNNLKTTNAQMLTHRQMDIVKFKFEFRQLPVFFCSATVGLDKALNTRRFSLKAPAFNFDDDIDVHPAKDGVAAIEWAASKDIEPTMIKPGWMTTATDKLIPVLRVDGFNTIISEPVSYYLHAHTMQIVHVEPLLDKQNPTGAILRENPVTTPDSILVDLLYLDEPKNILAGQYAHVKRCVDIEKCTESITSTYSNSLGNFIFEPILEADTFGDSFAEVNAYYHVSTINKWTRKSFGWDKLFLGEEWILIKVGKNWYNAAFYRGNEETAPYIIFGQSEIDMAYDADIIYHEFGHAINRSLRDHPWYLRDKYGMDTTPFGIEEGLADIWSNTLSGDPVSNSYVLLTRSADNDLVCPDHLRSEGHMEARIISGFGWDVREEIGAFAWEQIVYRTVSFLPENAVLDTFVDTLANSALELAQEQPDQFDVEFADIILEKGFARGFFNPDCTNRFVTIKNGEKGRAYGYGRIKTGGRNYPFGLQWKLVTPKEFIAFRLYLTWQYPDVEPNFKVYVSRGKPVEIVWPDISELKEGEARFKAIADYTFDSPEYIDFPWLGLEPLEPEEEIYVLLSSNTSDFMMVIDCEASFLKMQPATLEPLSLPIKYKEINAKNWSPSCSYSHGGHLQCNRDKIDLISLILR